MDIIIVDESMATVIPVGRVVIREDVRAHVVAEGAKKQKSISSGDLLNSSRAD
jgi:hypothetical protein